MIPNHPEVFIFILSSAFVFFLFGLHYLSQTAFGQAVMRKRKVIIALLGAGALAMLLLSEA